MKIILWLMWAAVVIAFFLALFAFITRDNTSLLSKLSLKELLQKETDQQEPLLRPQPIGPDATSTPRPIQLAQPTPTPIPVVHSITPDVPADTPKPSKLD